MSLRMFLRFIYSVTIICALLLVAFGEGEAEAQTQKPVLKTLSSTAVTPGSTLTVTGKNFGNIAKWNAVVELQSGQKFTQTPVPVSNTQFKITVPAIYTGYNVTEKNAQHRQRIQQVKFIYVTQGTMMSNKLPFNIISFYPILDSIHPSSAYVGDTILVNGGNWDKTTIYYPSQMYWAVFEYLPGKSVKTNILKPPMQNPEVPVPYLPNTCLVGILQIKVPNVYAGKSQAEQDAISKYMGKLYIYGPFGPNSPSNTLNIKIMMKPATSIPAGSCPGGKQLKGFSYVGQPGCATMNKADHPSAYLTCDATGYYCCEHSTGAKTKCGTDKWTFQADCMRYCAAAAGNCLTSPLIRDGIFYGCYKTTQ
ncbi:MAG: hypothetical protein NT022_03915 [Deltaproteobacteria bacterium]|nr:hypothetical protein [Deltaproteobacteria bacterium]